MGFFNEIMAEKMIVLSNTALRHLSFLISFYFICYKKLAAEAVAKPITVIMITIRIIATM